MYVVTVDFQVASAHVEEFLCEVVANADCSLRNEIGCHRFDVTTDKNDRAHVFLYELYEDEQAFQDHLVTDHFKDFDKKVSNWVMSKKVGVFALVSGSPAT
jgi:quinol monooxygenase YgiN